MHWVSKKLTLHLVDTEGAARRKSVHNRAGRNCSEHLGQDVENTSEDADLGADQQAQSHCWVQVCAADVAQSLRQCGDGQRKGQRDLQLQGDLLPWNEGGGTFPDDGWKTDEYEQQHADKFCRHGPPEAPAFYFSHLGLECVWCVKPNVQAISVFIAKVSAQREEEREKRNNDALQLNSGLSTGEKIKLLILKENILLETS